MVVIDAVSVVVIIIKKKKFVVKYIMVTIRCPCEDPCDTSPVGKKNLTLYYLECYFSWHIPRIPLARNSFE